MARGCRVAIVGSYPPPYGGISTNVMQLAARLRKDNYEVRVFSPLEPVEADPEFVASYNLRSCHISRGLLRSIMRFGPDVIHSHQSTVDWRAGAVSTILRIPIIHHVHGERFPAEFRDMSRFRQHILRSVLRASDSVIAVSEDLVNFIEGLRVLNGQSVVLIPSLLPLDAPDGIFESEITPDCKLDIVSSAFYPFTNSHYGFDLIPLVAKRLLERGVGFHWYLVGQASSREVNAFDLLLCKHGVRHVVSFLGELKRPQMLALLRRCDLYVRTKSSDSFGVVIAEAHQLGCHCLFADNNPYFQEGRRLTAYRVGDVNSLANQLLKIHDGMESAQPRATDSPFRAEGIRNLEMIKGIYEKVLVRRAQKYRRSY